MFPYHFFESTCSLFTHMPYCVLPVSFIRRTLECSRVEISGSLIQAVATIAVSHTGSELLARA